MISGEMDSPAMINESAFHPPSAVSYNLAEIWLFSINGGELRKKQFGQGLGHFAESTSVNRDILDDGPIVQGHIGLYSDASRKWYDRAMRMTLPSLFRQALAMARLFQAKDQGSTWP